MPLASSANLDVSNLCQRLYRSQMRGADQGLRQRQGSQLLRGDREFLFLGLLAIKSARIHEFQILGCMNRQLSSTCERFTALSGTFASSTTI